MIVPDPWAARRQDHGAPGGVALALDVDAAVRRLDERFGDLEHRPRMPRERPLNGAFRFQGGGLAVVQAPSAATTPIGFPVAFDLDSARPGARTATKSAPRSRTAAPPMRPCVKPCRKAVCACTTS